MDLNQCTFNQLTLLYCIKQLMIRLYRIIKQHILFHFTLTDSLPLHIRPKLNMTSFYQVSQLMSIVCGYRSCVCVIGAEGACGLWVKHRDWQEENTSCCSSCSCWWYFDLSSPPLHLVFILSTASTWSINVSVYVLYVSTVLYLSIHPYIHPFIHPPLEEMLIFLSLFFPLRNQSTFTEMPAGIHRHYGHV